MDGNLPTTDGRVQGSAALPHFNSISAQGPSMSYKGSLEPLGLLGTQNSTLVNSIQVERIDAVKFRRPHHEKQKCRASA